MAAYNSAVQIVQNGNVTKPKCSADLLLPVKIETKDLELSGDGLLAIGIEERV